MAEMRAFLAAVADRAADPDGGADAAGAARRARVRTAVLLEGLSDLAAVEALAAARGRDLAAEGVAAVPMGGAMNVGRYAALLGPTGLGLRLAGLCDRNERGWYERGFARAGAPGDGVFGCAADLEDELVRALGTARIEEVFRTEGDLPAWRTFERQPAQRDRTPEQRLRRFLGTRKGRKIRYGRLLVEALDPAAVPAPLDGLFRYLGPGPAAHC